MMVLKHFQNLPKNQFNLFIVYELSGRNAKKEIFWPSSTKIAGKI